MDLRQQSEYAARLYARRGDAVTIRDVRVQIGDWMPIPQDCHGNVATWIEYDKKSKPVYGWLVADYSGIGSVSFFAHSIVENEEGELLDITPNLLPYRYPFIRDA